MHPQVFLLSPAYCGGRRAASLLKPKSDLALAKRLAEGTLTLGEAFAFMSGLYFRGKLAYAGRFGWVENCPARPTTLKPTYVITPTRGLQSPDTVVSAATLQEFATVEVEANNHRYRSPLQRDLEQLAVTASAGVRMILLGSIATGKYIDVLGAVLSNRLYFPAAFVGRGDMSRGGLMLRSVAAGSELDYTPCMPNTSRHGPRPPKLTPAFKIP